MDFWDVAKVLVRRWFVSVPLLLITAAACGLVAVNTQPDYIATVHVALVPGSGSRPDSPTGADTFNPWEPEALAEAVIIPLQTKELADSMKLSGFKGEWEVGNGLGTLAVVTIAVTGPSSAESTRTAQHLVNLVFEDVKRRQLPAKLTPVETIKAQQIEATPTIEKKSIKTIRAIVVIGAAGMILTLGVVLAVDAVIRRRSRRRMTPGGSALSAAGLASVPGSPMPSTSLSSGFSHSRPRLGSATDTNDHTIVLNRVLAVDPVDSTRLPANSAQAGSPVGAAPVSPSPISPSPFTSSSPYSSSLGSSSVPSPRDGLEVSYETGSSVDDDDDAMLPEDSTVVLPLSNSPGWRHNNGGKPTATRP